MYQWQPIVQQRLSVCMFVNPLVCHAQTNPLTFSTLPFSNVNNKAALKQLYGVATLITDLPPTSFTTLTKEDEKKKKYMWHMTRDIWHVSHDRGGWWTFSKNFSSLALTVWDLKCFEDISAFSLNVVLCWIRSVYPWVLSEFSSIYSYWRKRL